MNVSYGTTRYGADIVYSEEIVDKRVVASVRQFNDVLGTVDFLDKGGEQGGRVGNRMGSRVAHGVEFG